MLVTAQSTEDRLTIPFDRARVSRRRCFGDKFRRDPAATDDDVAAEAIREGSAGLGDRLATR
jgi:hypothetical protein